MTRSWGLCASCGQKRAVAWAERTVEEMLPDVPYVQLVFTITRILRKAFLFHRELYGELSRVAYAATRDFYREHFPSLDEPIPAMLVVPQSFGDLLIPHPHLHAPASLGVFDKQGIFHPAPDDLDFSPLSRLFAQYTFKMLLEKEATTPDRVEMIKSWRHSGFNVDATRRVAAGERAAFEKLLQYIDRPPVSLQRLRYGQDGMVTYKGRFHPRLGRDYQFVTGLEFLAMLVPHIQLRYEAKIRYFGALSTKKRIHFGARPRSSATTPPASSRPSRKRTSTRTRRSPTERRRRDAHNCVEAGSGELGQEGRLRPCQDHPSTPGATTAGPCPPARNSA